MGRRLTRAELKKAVVEVCQRIRQVRKAKGLSAKRLGRAVGLSQPQITRIETGQQGVRGRVLVQLASVLNVSPVVFHVDEKTARRIEKFLPKGSTAGSTAPLGRKVSKAAVAKALRQTGRRVQQIRKARRLTGMALAKAVGCSSAQISRMEAGLHGVRTAMLMRLAAALNVPPTAFLVDEETAQALAKRAGGRRMRG